MKHWNKIIAIAFCAILAFVCFSLPIPPLLACILLVITLVATYASYFVIEEDPGEAKKGFFIYLGVAVAFLLFMYFRNPDSFARSCIVLLAPGASTIVRAAWKLDARK
ncbi:hypothetical protein [Murdochiella vaginalis]|uniref:hypothetical protein n=1 Tax=Murdochiella vaginalis TaxID=1852373 RepID=UPI0008FE6793|nr:hypothetical protein [Murdochiella vaginalis]